MSNKERQNIEGKSTEGRSLHFAVRSSLFDILLFLAIPCQIPVNGYSRAPPGGAASPGPFGGDGALARASSWRARSRQP
jgi:hypothetical protein